MDRNKTAGLALAALLLAPLAALHAGALPDFKSDAAADQWLRTQSPAYLRMAEFVDHRWGYAFGTATNSPGGLAYLKDGKGHIDLNGSLCGTHRVSVIIFELTNLFQQDRHEEITAPVRRGESRDATRFALLREAVEYDGLRLHRDVLAELERKVGELPPEMITWVSSTATNLTSYTLPYAYDYFKAQASGGHTDHYRRLFETHAAEARQNRDANRAELIRALQPLSVRGVNYFPRETPWGGMWTKTPADVWEKDMALAASLGCNTVRTFVTFSQALEQAGLLRSDGTPTPAYLAKVEDLLAAAWRHGIRLILCLEFSSQGLAAPDAADRWKRALTAVVIAHRDDGRVLLWDLMNEPDDDAKWTDGTRAYLRAALPFIRQLDTNHLATVGIAYRADRLAEVGLPDVMQYHEYCPKAVLFEKGGARVSQSIAGQRRTGGSRPLLIGECGMSTARDPQRGAEESLHDKISAASGTEAEQARLYDIVLAAAEKERVAGVLAWCLHDYPIKNPNESHFGLVRPDGSLKPAGLTLRDTFSRWNHP